jgi:hypothetical protein
MGGGETIWKSVSPLQNRQSTNHWVPGLYPGVLHSVTSTTWSKAICSSTFEEDVITEGLDKILTTRLGLYWLTANEDRASVTRGSLITPW